MKTTLFQTILLLSVLCSMDNDMFNVYAQRRRQRRSDEEAAIEETTPPPVTDPESVEEAAVNDEDGMTEEQMAEAM